MTALAAGTEKGGYACIPVPLHSIWLGRTPTKPDSGSSAVRRCPPVWESPWTALDCLDLMACDSASSLTRESASPEDVEMGVSRVRSEWTPDDAYWPGVKGWVEEIRWCRCQNRWTKSMDARTRVTRQHFIPHARKQAWRWQQPPPL